MSLFVNALIIGAPVVVAGVAIVIGAPRIASLKRLTDDHSIILTLLSAASTLSDNPKPNGLKHQ